jgi:serine/threonine-protein kinase
MTLSSGARLGPYEILSAIGAGGMGEVYKARDTRLDRSVAIKVLPPAFSGDPDRRVRFEREAKTIAGLNHPHICTLHDVGEHDGSTFLVMEHLSGDTLAQRLEKGPLPLEQALTVATEIADALAAAHRQGVVHRDLKPGNVMLTKTGAKLLDFGLAKLTGHGEQAAAASLASVPTQTRPLTSEGAIVGTLQYMAPEQVEGKPADARTDLWALGAILYEMLTGKRAFAGASAASLIGNIMNAEPVALTTLQPLTPPSMDRLVRKCLAKAPDDRWDSAHDVADELRWMRETSGVATLTGTRPRGRRGLWTAVGVAGITIISLASILAYWLLSGQLRPESSPSVVNSTIKIEPAHWLDGMRRELDMQRPSRTALAVSHDGAFVIYSAIEENPGPQAKAQLFLRRLDHSAATPIHGTEGGISPFLSPDDRWVGFWADGRLKKIGVEGGVPTVLCDVPWPFGADWGQDNTIVFADGYHSGISRVSAEGGKPETLTTPDAKRSAWSHRLPSWLPNGKAVLFTVMRHGWDAEPRVGLLRLDTREWQILLPDAADAKYVPTGHLLFLRQGTLMAVRFDLSTYTTTGQPVPLVENVMQAFTTADAYSTAAGQFSVSDTGSLAYATGGVAPDRRNWLVWVDQKGVEQPVTSLRSAFFAPRLSPDGTTIAYVTTAREAQVWIYDLRRETPQRLPVEGRAEYPIWAAGGTRLLFGVLQPPVSNNLYWQPSDGSAPMVRLTTSENRQFAGSLSPDERTLAVVERHPDTRNDIVLLDLPSGRVTPFLHSSSNKRYPDFSPDGRWIAYSSDESGRDEVYVRPFSGAGQLVRVSREGGVQPLWARDSRQLFYRWQDQMWVVDVRTDGHFAVSPPRMLFQQAGYSLGEPIRGYDLSHESPPRFLMVKIDDRKPTPVTELTLVQNWFNELRAKMPVGR